VRRILVAAMVVLSTSVSFARPQTGHKSWFKVVGRVLDGNGRPIQWGRVYVKDTHAHFLRINPVDREGHFSVWLDARLDYEVYAEQDDLVSEKVIVSGSHEASDMVIALKLSKNQENH